MHCRSVTLSTCALVLAGGAVAASIASQLAVPPSGALALVLLTLAVAFPAFGWLHRLQGARVVAWMVVGGLLGWLAGVRYELGPFGLLILGDWCSSPAFQSVAAVMTKVRLFPLSHLGMIVGGLLAMALAMRLGGERGVLRCCVVALVAMPLAVLLSDLWLLFGLDVPSVPPAVQMLGIMSALMVASGTLVRSTRRALSPSPAQ